MTEPLPERPACRHLSLLMALVAGLLCACGDSAMPPTAQRSENAGNPGSPTTPTVKCTDTSGRWVSAWQAPPTDAVMTGDASLTSFAAGPSQTFRNVFTPLGNGGVVRLHLSNRFGQLPVVFTKLSIAKRMQGASIDATTSVPVTFGCQTGVTLPAGGDVISDPIAFPVAAFDDIAVSIAATDPGTIPTHHFTARQTSYATLPGMGDHADDASASAFTQATTQRLFVTGLDVQSTTASAILAFGDSITDGFQGPATLVPQNIATVDLNQRYPDYLKHRIDAAGLPFFIANAGISGNRILQDGEIPAFGPAAITRVTPDVLTQAGVGTVIWLEGINDIGQDSLGTLTAAQLEAGYTQVIGQMHAAGLKVLLGTLTPCGNNSMYGNAHNNALRDSVNTWIRTQSPADAIIDFDAAVRDATNPEVIATPYDGGDGLHFSAAGYERMAQAVDLGLLRVAAR